MNRPHDGGSDDGMQSPQRQPSWIETTLIPKLREKGGVLNGQVRAPYIDEYIELAEMKFALTLAVLEPYDMRYRTGLRYAINGDVAVQHALANQGETEKFAVTIDTDGKVNVGSYTTNEPDCIGKRIMYILYAAAELWNLLPDGAKM